MRKGKIQRIQDKLVVSEWLTYSVQRLADSEKQGKKKKNKVQVGVVLYLPEISNV